ncbi:MAG TPA: N-acetylmuramoyl-L-alanine amidase [Acetobacteraceae bacterium]|nr:N-acetylmuramoyl-L-alanine amidase [Acetobacteraceae bacterium]
MQLDRRAWLRLSVGAALAPSPALARRHRPQPQPLVVIDPGHGGKDPGCIGHAIEKHVVLAVGLALRRQLLASRHCRVEMTRSTDVFIPLEQRVRFARQRRAAVMVSVHANASSDSGARGANVYRFAYRASDPLAAAAQRLENSADRSEASASSQRGMNVQHILANLMRRETIRHSSRLQSDLVAGLDDDWRLCGGGARHARFVVLSAPDVASVLVELGFLTNRLDAAALSNPAHQAALARTMGEQIDKYLVALQPRRS